MGRVFITLYIVVGLIAAMASIYTNTNHDTFVSNSSQQAASVSIGVAPDPSIFNETGTLVFYPNNVGPVPYIFYQDSQGNVASKALVFPDGSSVESSWVGARILVIGHVVNAHVVVSSIRYIAGP